MYPDTCVFAEAYRVWSAFQNISETNVKGITYCITGWNLSLLEKILNVWFGVDWKGLQLLSFERNFRSRNRKKIISNILLKKKGTISWFEPWHWKSCLVFSHFTDNLLRNHTLECAVAIRNGWDRLPEVRQMIPKYPIIWRLQYSI